MADFKAEMHQIQFWLGLRIRPPGGAYSASPDPLAEFKGPTSKGRGVGGKWEGSGGEGMVSHSAYPHFISWRRLCLEHLYIGDMVPPMYAD